MSSKESTSQPSDLELMMYADGELEPARAAEIEAYLAAAGQDESALVVGGVRELGEALRTYLELETDRIEEDVPAFGGMWQQIERRIHANGVNGERAAEGRGERAERPADAGRRAAPEGAGLWATMRGWLGQHRGYFVTGLVSAGAVAALLLVVRPHDRVVERVVRQGGVVAQPTPATLKLKSEPPEVEDLEVYDGSGTILTIAPEGDDDSAATVIWISNDDEQNREGPL